MTKIVRESGTDLFDLDIGAVVTRPCIPKDWLKQMRESFEGCLSESTPATRKWIPLDGAKKGKVRVGDIEVSAGAYSALIFKDVVGFRKLAAVLIGVATQHVRRAHPLLRGAVITFMFLQIVLSGKDRSAFVAAMSLILNQRFCNMDTQATSHEALARKIFKDLEDLGEGDWIQRGAIWDEISGRRNAHRQGR